MFRLTWMRLIWHKWWRWGTHFLERWWGWLVLCLLLYWDHKGVDHLLALDTGLHCLAVCPSLTSVQGVNILWLITDVKQSWACLIHGWVTVLPALLQSVWYGTMASCATLHIYTSGTWLGKKAGVCAVMSMWLVHIKLPTTGFLTLLC